MYRIVIPILLVNLLYFCSDKCAYSDIACMNAEQRKQECRKNSDNYQKCMAIAEDDIKLCEEAKESCEESNSPISPLELQ